MDRRDFERFEPIIQLRKMKENICAQKFASTMQQVRKIEQTIVETLSEREKILEELDSIQQQGMIVVRDVQDLFNYIIYLDREIEQLERYKKELLAKAEAERLELEREMAKRKMFEQLKKKREQQFLMWVGKQMQKELDDLASTQFNRIL